LDGQNLKHENIKDWKKKKDLGDSVFDPDLAFIRLIDAWMGIFTKGSHGQ
jgi:hypothetical protein